MSEITKELKEELKKSLEQLGSLRDEMRVRVHLGSMDVKRRWDELEPRVHAAVEQAKKDVSKASQAAVHDVTEALKKLKASLS